MMCYNIALLKLIKKEKKLNYKTNFIKNLNVILSSFKNKSFKELIFPIVVGYCFTCLIYNFAILSFSWHQNIIIPKQYFDNLLIGEFIPLLTLGIIYSRVFTINYLSLTYQKALDIIIYAGICFLTGYFYSNLKLNFTNIQEKFILFYILFLFIINIILSLAKEYKVSKILNIFCVNNYNNKALFFKGQQ